MEPAVMMLLEEIRQRVVAQSVLPIAIFLMLTAALLALLYGAPAMDCAAQVLAGMSIYCLVWLLAGLIFHEETVCWTIGVIRGKLPRK